ncbi:MAG TPA: glycosyltransferase family 4 protein [Burkholderiales bacterium]|nr:glycosyltransferase family 4 protein [Burkholderiales bacterium]
MKVIFFANTDWYLYNFRLPLAKFLRARGFEVVMLSPAGSYGPLLQAEGFRWIGLDMDRRSLNPARELALIRRISAVYAAEKPDIVHHFTIKCVVYGSLIARRHGIRNRVNAVTGMGYVFSDEGYKARLLRPVVRNLIRATLGGEGSRLILQNRDDLAAFLAADLTSTERTHVIMGSGVDTARFHPAAEPGQSDTMRVLLASRLLWDKGIREYIDAANLLKEAGLPVEFLLAGNPDPGNPASVPEAQIAKWQEGQAVRYLGHIADMPRLLAEIDVAVLPSYREGVPRSLLEAAACGLPIVTTDVPGCREVVKHGVNGLLVPARDPAALAAAIRFMWERPEERARMGSAARCAVLEYFDQDIVFEKTFAVYRDLLSAAV